ncbi:MAG: winged helix-turn-helix domain-containing protein [Pyrinomonadaceae bacterium]
MVKSSRHKIYEFENFRLDADHLMLYCGADEISLAPKAVETLLVLVERRGEILSKDELMETIWSDSIVEESNLAKYLHVLRTTLGNQQNGKPFIETFRRRGYRFNGEVSLPDLLPDVNLQGVKQDFVPQQHATTNGGAIREATTGKVIPLADWRHESEADAKTPHTDLPAAETANHPVGEVNKRKLRFAAAGVMAAGAVLAFTYSYFTNHSQIDSIAVMPFVNESGDAELEYLSDGMTDNLIGSLLKIPDLEVKASSTMFRYKGTDLDAATIGKELNVEAVLSPRMVQRGEDLTLYLELVDSRTENSLWQQTYNRKTSQLGVLQRDVIRDLVRELSINLTDSTKQKFARDYTENAEATRLYLKGLFLIRKLNEPEVREGIGYLWQAIEHDPSYAPAYAMIASAHRSLTLCCDFHPSELVEARTAAQRALGLDENLAEAHSALASSLYLYDWNFAEAEKHFLRALELNPNSAMSHFLYGDFLGRMGRGDEAATERNRAIEIEPFSPYFNAFALNHGDPNTALERVRFVIDLNPNFYFSHFMAAGVYQRRKMYPEAIAEYRRAKELAPEQTWSDINFSRMLIEMGEIDQSRAILDEMLRRSKSRYVPPFHIAAVYNQLGDTEQAFAWLEKAYQVRDPKMTFLKTTWKNLEGDPRFQDIKRRVGF